VVLQIRGIVLEMMGKTGNLTLVVTLTVGRVGKRKRSRRS
jgi:hypothetical protein